jgi:hypothetical protein
MKTLLFLTGALIGTLLTSYYYSEETKYYPLECSKEASFVIEMVANDTTLQRYITDYGYRCQVRHEIKNLK